MTSNAADANKMSPGFFLIWSKSRGSYCKLRKLLADDGWQVLLVEDLSSLRRLPIESKAPLVANSRDTEITCLAILDPTRRPTKEELVYIREFSSRGALNPAMLVASSACENEDSPRDGVNLNEMLRPFGVALREDCIIRPNPYKLYHPQEAVLEDFVADGGFGGALQRHVAANPSEDSLIKLAKVGPRLVYPRGCSLSVNSGLSTVVMTSSCWALPSEQPIGVVHRPAAGAVRDLAPGESSDPPASAAIILGSASMMSDQYIAKEDNQALVRTLLEFLTNKNFPINASDAQTP